MPPKKKSRLSELRSIRLLKVNHQSLQRNENILEDPPEVKPNVAELQQLTLGTNRSKKQKKNRKNDENVPIKNFNVVPDFQAASFVKMENINDDYSPSETGHELPMTEVGGTSSLRNFRKKISNAITPPSTVLDQNGPIEIEESSLPEPDLGSLNISRRYDTNVSGKESEIMICNLTSSAGANVTYIPEINSIDTIKTIESSKNNPTVVLHDILQRSNPSTRNILRNFRLNEDETDDHSDVENQENPTEMDYEDEAMESNAVDIKSEPEDSDDDPLFIEEFSESEEYDDVDDSWLPIEPKVNVSTDDCDESTSDDANRVDFVNQNLVAYHKRMKSLSRTDKLKAFRREYMMVKPLKKHKKMKLPRFKPTGDTNNYSFKCPFCPFKTDTVLHMRRHRIRHVSEGAFNCKLCEFATKSKVDYKDHLVQHYKDFSSDSEDSDIEEVYSLDTHKINDAIIHSNQTDESAFVGGFQEGNLQMSRVKVMANLNSAVVAPETNVLYEKILDLRCQYCPFFTRYRSVMNQHKTIHLSEGIMYCPQCDFSTSVKEEYKIHLMKHYKRDSLSCEYCGYTTTSQYSFQTHKMRHSQKTYSCEFCKYSTGFKRAFKFHLLKHSAKKLLRCKQCPFITKYRHNYRQHMAIHTGKGLMFCDFCSFYSAWETNFSRHLAKHKMEEEARKVEEQAWIEAEDGFPQS